MPLTKKRGKAFIITFTIILVIVLPYTQYRVYLRTVKVTRQQLQLNSIRSQLIYFVDALGNASRSFVLTRDPQWQLFYNRLQQNFNFSLEGLNSLLPNGSELTTELTDSHDQLMKTEENAFLLVQSGQTARANELLNGKEYLREQRLFSFAMQKMIQRLEVENDKLFGFLQREAIKNIMVRGAIALLILLGWLWFSRLNSRWKSRLEELTRQRVTEERAAAKKLEQVNGQLRELSIYLQDVRERERMSLANEINEKLGQQIAVLTLKITEVKRIQNVTDQSWQLELEDIVCQLNQILNQIRNLATEVFPLILRDLGLQEALQWESERLTIQSGIAVNFSSQVEDVNLDQRTSTTLFRTYQQKLQNSLSQGANAIHCSLHLETDILILSILDDSQINPNKGNDLLEDLALNEWLQSIRGRCHTQYKPNEGNLFTLSIPYSMTI